MTYERIDRIYLFVRIIAVTAGGVMGTETCSSTTIGSKTLPAKQLNKKKKGTKLRGFGPQSNYTDRATVACRRS
jgi:hypothetical protein